MTSEKRKKRNAERQFILEVIEVYKDLPALWKVKSDAYSNRAKKVEAYKLLLHKYNERYPDSTLEDLKKKLNTLRTNFRSELRKVERSAKYGAGTDDLYQPTSWYYESLMFLTDQETTSDSIGRPTISQVDEDQSSQEVATESEELSQDICQDDAEIAETRTVIANTSTESAELTLSSWTSATPCIKHNARKATTSKRKLYDPNQAKDELISLATKRSKEPIPNEDEYLTQAKVWANELRSMDSQQQIYAKKAIGDIIFEGHCGTLNRNSVQINCGTSATTQSSRSSTPFSACSDHVVNASGQYVQHSSRRLLSTLQIRPHLTSMATSPLTGAALTHATNRKMHNANPEKT